MVGSDQNGIACIVGTQLCTLSPWCKTTKSCNPANSRLLKARSYDSVVLQATVVANKFEFTGVSHLQAMVSNVSNKKSAGDSLPAGFEFPVGRVASAGSNLAFCQVMLPHTAANHFLCSRTSKINGAHLGTLPDLMGGF